MALNILKQPFIRLSYAQGSTTYFNDENNYYYKLVATSASDAAFTQVTPAPSNGNVIPNSSTVFVEFQDHSTLIINNMNFYGKPTGGSNEPTVKLATGSLPESSQDTQLYSSGDVVLAIDLLNTTPKCELGVCTYVNDYDDSGVTNYEYTWTKLFTQYSQSRTMRIVDSIPLNSDSEGIPYQIGDVIGVPSTHSDSDIDVFDGFTMYVCTGTGYEDSGVYITEYTWQEILTYPNTVNTNTSFS